MGLTRRYVWPDSWPDGVTPEMRQHLKELAADMARAHGISQTKVMSILRRELETGSVPMVTYGYVDEYGNLIEVKYPQVDLS